MMWKQVVLCSTLLLLLVGLTRAQDESPEKDDSLEAYEGQKNCFISQVQPETVSNDLERSAMRWT